MSTSAGEGNTGSSSASCPRSSDPLLLVPGAGRTRAGTEMAAPPLLRLCDCVLTAIGGPLLLLSRASVEIWNLVSAPSSTLESPPLRCSIRLAAPPNPGESVYISLPKSEFLTEPIPNTSTSLHLPLPLCPSLSLPALVRGPAPTSAGLSLSPTSAPPLPAPLPTGPLPPGVRSGPPPRSTSTSSVICRLLCVRACA